MIARQMLFTTTEIFLLVLSLAVIILALVILYEEIRINRILKGKTAKDLEETMISVEKEYRSMKNFRDAMSAYLKKIDERISRSIQGISTEKFNAWKGSGEGGNQSFASAFISEKGNGIILSSLYSRDRTSVFAKPIENGKSSSELTKEEKEVLKKALESVHERE
jgi:hypothetical protein